RLSHHPRRPDVGGGRAGPPGYGARGGRAAPGRAAGLVAGPPDPGGPPPPGRGRGPRPPVHRGRPVTRMIDRRSVDRRWTARPPPGRMNPRTVDGGGRTGALAVGGGRGHWLAAAGAVGP